MKEQVQTNPLEALDSGEIRQRQVYEVRRAHTAALERFTDATYRKMETFMRSGAVVGSGSQTMFAEMRSTAFQAGVYAALGVEEISSDQVVAQMVGIIEEAGKRERELRLAELRKGKNPGRDGQTEEDLEVDEDGVPVLIKEFVEKREVEGEITLAFELGRLLLAGNRAEE